MLKKNKRRCEKAHRFFISFSSFFREKSMKNHAKRVKIIIVHKISKKSRVDRSFLAKKQILVDFWDPPGYPGASRDDPGNSQNH